MAGPYPMDNAAIDDLYTGGIDKAREASRLRQLGSYAHFPGTGPEGRICLDCVFFGKRPRSDGRVLTGKCGRHAAMQQIKVAEVHYIKAGSQSCKYFDEVKELDDGTTNE